MMHTESSVRAIKGIGDKKAQLLQKLGIETIRDLVYYMPRSYESQGARACVRDLKNGETYHLVAVVDDIHKTKRIRKGLSLASFTLADETGRAEAVFFNQPYIANMFQKGDRVYVSGKTKMIGRRIQFTNPHMEKSGGQHEGINPVYALTAGLTQKTMRIILKTALAQYVGNAVDIFPNDFRSTYGLAELNFALKNIHFPKDEPSLDLAKRRLIFEELLLFNIALREHESRQSSGAAAFQCGDDVTQQFLDKLGFVPTAAQRRVMSEIREDLKTQRPMNRLLQGDVGSGKTMPAMFAMYMCCRSGFQSVMMAPTEVLARQHFENALRLFSDENINIELIVGSTPAAQKKVIYENVAGGMTDIVIGTHAVLYDNLTFARLGLVIADEQHRFGIGQRAALESKTAAPHTLIMSATPIPRTLALILYGRTDISILDEMPPGRQPVKTFCVPESKRNGMYDYIENEMNQGAQVFVVCPMIEQNDDFPVRSSEEVYATLCDSFGASRVAHLHGRMSSREKDDVMQRFKAKEFGILVSTTVIEVGIDIPSATIIVIENAERFGLAQLHQLRGRVGRGGGTSYCFLMSDATDNARLLILTKTNDGFKIAEEDLRLRGPGQFLGKNQSGMSDLYMANLIRDMKLLSQTRDISAEISVSDSAFYAVLKKRHICDSSKNSKTLQLIKFASAIYNYQCIIKCIGQIIGSTLLKGGEQNGENIGP